MDKLDRIKYLVDYLNECTAKYDAGNPQISDKEWDSLYFELVQLEKETSIIMVDSPTQIIHYNLQTELEKVVHSHKMLSAAKTKDWNEFIQYFDNRDVTGMVKLDGLTLTLEYENGSLVRAETRGNGTIGENVLHNAEVISSIPKRINYYDNLTVDGEIICKLNDFEAFKNEYSNPRNFASGSIRLLDPRECEKRHLTFVAWNIVDGFNELNNFIDKLNRLDKLGFIIVPWTSSFDWDAKEFLIEQAREEGYPIDGLVGRFTDIEYGESLGNTEHHFKSIFAFKFYDELYDTTLKSIDWTMGRTGQLTPVAVFDPVDDGDSIIERASLHNLSIMEKLLGKPYEGQLLKVFKSNMIIPQIESAEIKNSDCAFEIPIVCPICGENLSIKQDNDSKFLVCENSVCEGKLVNHLDHFCGKKGLDMKGISKATLEKLINWGWVNSISDLFLLNQHEQEWIKKDGFGQKSVSKILTTITNASVCELSAFIAALGIPLIGSTYAKQLAKKYATWADFYNAVENKFDFSTIEGFGAEMNKALLSFDYTEANSLLNNYYLTINNSLFNNTTVNNSLENLTVCITGKLNIFKNREELQKVIEDCGGKVVSSVSSKTSILINNDITSVSSKNINAQKLNVPIITEETFCSTYLKK